jgi:hypothetical protein
MVDFTYWHWQWYWIRSRQNFCIKHQSVRNKHCSAKRSTVAEEDQGLYKRISLWTVIVWTGLIDPNPYVLTCSPRSPNKLCQTQTTPIAG